MNDHKPPREFWPPLLVGIGLGVTTMAMFLLTSHGLGAGGFFTRVAVWLADQVSNDWTFSNAYFGPYLDEGHPMQSWIVWEVAGMAVGALLGSLMARRFRLGIVKGPRVSRGGRLGLAVTGGVLSGFGAQLAGGCTSGLGLSGGATLAVAAFVFLAGFFIAGLLVSIWGRRAWQ